MKLKPGVKLLGIRPELLVAIMMVDSIYQKHGQELVITSVVDGIHKKASTHYVGNGFDARTRFFSEAEKGVVAEEVCQAFEGTGFYLFIHSTHFHIGYKP